MKNVRWLLTALFIIGISISLFARRISFRGHGGWNIKQRSINMDVPIRADIDETSKVLSLEFLEYVGEVLVSVVDTNGNMVYEEMVDTQNVSSYIISLDGVASGSYELSISDPDNYAKVFFIYNNFKFKSMEKKKVFLASACALFGRMKYLKVVKVHQK